MTSLQRWPWQPRTAPENRDPLSIGIAIITAAEAVSGVAIGFEAASFVGSAVLIGASITANYLLSAKPDGSGALPDLANRSANAQEIRLNQRHPTPSKRVIYGRALVGGGMFFEKVKPPYLYHGWMVAAHEIEGFAELRIARDVLVFSALGELLPQNTILTPIGKRADDGSITTTPAYPDNLLASLRYGAADQAIDPLLEDDFADLDASFRQRGITTMVLRYKYPGASYNDFQDMWGNVQAPNPLALVKGRKLFDIRDPQQRMWTDPRDPDDVASAEATWRWSNCAALVQADYLVQPYGGRISPSKMDWDKVARAADYDDDLVGTTTDGEFIRRHTIDGIVTLNQPPIENMRAMLSANGGFVLNRGGRVWVQSSQPLDPVLTITDDLLAGGFEFNGHKPKRDLVNRVFSRFVAQEREYQQVDGPRLDRTDLQEADQEILTATLALPFTLDHRRAQRLQKAYLERGRLGRSVTVRLRLKALDLCDGELIGGRVRFDSALFGVVNGDYRCLLFGFADNYSSIELQLAEYDPSIERDWHAPTDEQPFVVDDLDLS